MSANKTGSIQDTGILGYSPDTAASIGGSCRRTKGFQGHSYSGNRLFLTGTIIGRPALYCINITCFVHRHEYINSLNAKHNGCTSPRAIQAIQNGALLAVWPTSDPQVTIWPRGQSCCASGEDIHGFVSTRVRELCYAYEVLRTNPNGNDNVPHIKCVAADLTQIVHQPPPYYRPPTPPLVPFSILHIWCFGAFPAP